MSHHLADTLTHTRSSHLELGKSRLQNLSWLIIGPVNARTVNPGQPVLRQHAGRFQLSPSAALLPVCDAGGRLVGAGQAVVCRGRPGCLCLDRTNRQIGRHDVNILMLLPGAFALL